MQTSADTRRTAAAELKLEPDGGVTIVLQGLLDAESTGACWRQLQDQLRRRKVKTLVVDVSAVRFGGLIGIALVSYLRAGRMTPGVNASLRGLTPETEKLLKMVVAEEPSRAPHKSGVLRRLLEEMGSFVRGFLRDLRDQTIFIGTVLRTLPGALFRPKRMRWPEVRRILETAGANALPVISLFSWLVGLVMALEAAHPLRRLGAEIFVADMIGFSALRDTGPLVTAIMLAGRSGSAFAAELGTMKVNEELDALTTMGLDPIQFLVIQRLVAALLLTPLLALYSMLMSILGGVMVMRFMGFPPLMIYHEIFGRVGLHDFSLGLQKSAIFGLLIGGIACLRGLQTGESPRAVGVSTTRSVVTSIVLVILANTIFSSVEYVLNQ